MDPIHFSSLKSMSLSPMHYRYSVDHHRQASRAMLIGSAVHALVLGGQFHVWPGERRGKAWLEFEAAHRDGAPILNAKEAEEARDIACAVLSDPVVGELARVPHETEKEITWEWCGCPCAGRVDIIWPDAVGELKVANTADLDRFGRQATRMHYPAQLRWYQIGLGRPVDTSALIIAVESTPPYPVTVREVTQRALEMGEKQCRLWVEQVKVCEVSGSWPGYAQTIVPLDAAPESEEFGVIIDGEEVAL